ncbi:uncharacterized protein LOC128092290 [Culex pipiens pallens]|uniref:uncharacterized protein LOC128092290 n=1 Tax=Culex pipiens pallens TaxID=42434 RepID=UPI0022AA97B4|nr:uncharacterized protein LOC128092290 [Culex pipiens pallens]
MKPQVVRPDVPQASVHSIKRISDGIGQLIANASADLGPQNTILELESEKAELVRTLNAQKLENNELRLRLRNNQSTMEELRNEIDKLRVENSTKVTSELGPIQEQLQMQTQAVGVMVGKKAELMGTVGNFCLQRIGRSFPAPDEIGGKKENSSSWYASGTKQE